MVSGKKIFLADKQSYSNTIFVLFMGIIGKQAAQNSVSILLGTVIGAVNTILVLPTAFAEFPEGWGLLKVLLSYSLIFAQIFGFGAGNSFIRFSPRFEGKDLFRIQSYILLLPVLGMLILGAIFLFSGSSLVALINENDAYLIEGRLGLLFVLSIIMTFTFTLSGYIASVLRTTYYQFLNEFVIRVLYLGLSLAYLFDWLSFEAMVVAYVGSYGVILLLLYIHSIKHRLRWSSPFKAPEKKEVFKYSIFSILDRGSSIMINNLDIIMISLILDLERVAEYTLAFYIGSVVLIPQKSLQLITNPITAKAISEDNTTELGNVYRKSVLNQFLLGAVIFLAIWVNIDDVFTLLPEEFSYGKWVVLYIGLSKLFFMISGVSGAMIVYSNYYRVNLYLNIVLVVLTIMTNWYLIPIYQMDGAALATAISLFIYNLSKVIFVRKAYGIQPFQMKFIIGFIAFIGLAIVGSYWSPEWINSFWTIVIKGSLFTVISLALTLYLSDDLREMLLGIKKKYLK